MSNNPLLTIRRRNFINYLLAHIKSNGKKPEFKAKVEGKTIIVKLNKDNMEKFFRDVYEEQDCRQRNKYSENEIYESYSLYYTASGRITELGEYFVKYITKHMPDYLNNREFKHCEL